MKLFLDTASIDEIREINRWGVLGGVTTNPSLLEKENADPAKVWRQILDEVSGDVSLEVTAPDADEMVAQGTTLAQMGPNAIVKVPMTPDGLEAGTRLVAQGIRINVTLVFSPAQAILAAEAGAYIVSPFLGRVDDVASDGMAVLRSICDIYAVQGYDTKVLAASLRHPMHVV
jgi:transaldolase